jgi:hypothetical protein
VVFYPHCDLALLCQWQNLPEHSNKFIAGNADFLWIAAARAAQHDPQERSG